ncbi:MAG: recombinase family protein [Clostridia bacterium]|nr:recombinase family protein [Clostridia bacterium]
MGREKIYRVGIYIRLSREDGDDKESESVENQRDIIHKFIDENDDLELIEEYVDDGYTGTNFDRPNFKRMMQDVKKDRINAIITKDLSRFGRDHIDTGYYLEKYLPSNNIRYIAIGDGVDTETSAGLNFLIFKLSFNDYYSQDISNKIRVVKTRKQEKGEYQAPYAPFGYKKDPSNKNHLLINEETAPIVKRIFELYLKGTGTNKISKILNDENILAPGAYLNSKRYEKCSKKWNKSAIYRLLKEPVYIGTIVGHKSYKVNHKVKTRIKVPKNERYYVEKRHEPIIDIETFEAVQNKLAEGGKWRNRKNYNPIKQYMYCGHCGAKATMKTHKRQVKSGEIHEHQYFICSKKSDDYNNCDNGRIASSVVIPLLKESIKNECSKIVFSKGDLTSIYEQAKENSNNKKTALKKEIEKLEKDVKRIEKKIEQIYIDKLESIIRAEDFSKFYNLYQEQKEKNILKINDLKKQLEEANREKIINYKEIKKIAEQCLNMDELEPELLNKLIDRIEYLKGKKIKIRYKFMEYK